MPTPIIGDLLESTVGKVVDRITEKYLPSSMSEKEKAELRLDAQRLAVEGYKTAAVDIDSARTLAARDSASAPAWTGVLTVTHRPVWSFAMLGVFVWTVIAPYMGFPGVPLTDIHKEIMQTVIIFYFSGRSIEKAASTVWGRGLNNRD